MLVVCDVLGSEIVGGFDTDAVIVLSPYAQSLFGFGDIGGRHIGININVEFESGELCAGDCSIVVRVKIYGKLLRRDIRKDSRDGEGFVLISQVSYAVSTLLINRYSKKMSPVLLSGSQFFAGGILLFIIGKFMGGHLDKLTAAGAVLILYLALVSAVAYTLWSILLAHNPVSRIAILGFVNPLCSVILSALVLGEVQEAFNLYSLSALVMVCVGIYIVNFRKETGIS